MRSRKTDAARQGEKPNVPSYFGAAGVLGGFFKAFEQLLDLADQASRSDGTIEKQGEFRLPGREEAEGVYGVTIRTMVGPGGEPKPVLRPFGNLRKTVEGAVVEASREPILDVFEEGDLIQIIAELPGVAEPDIHYEVRDDRVRLSTAGHRKYNKEIRLAMAVEEAGAQASYKNGMFELKLRKKAERSEARPSPKLRKVAR